MLCFTLGNIWTDDKIYFMWWFSVFSCRYSLLYTVLDWFLCCFSEIVLNIKRYTRVALIFPSFYFHNLGIATFTCNYNVVWGFDSRSWHRGSSIDLLLQRKTQQKTKQTITSQQMKYVMLVQPLNVVSRETLSFTWESTYHWQSLAKFVYCVLLMLHVFCRRAELLEVYLITLLYLLKLWPYYLEASVLLDRDTPVKQAIHADPKSIR